MFSRILLGAVSVAGAIFVSAIAAAGSDGDASANASAVLPELTVAPPTDYPDVRLGNGSSSGQGAAFNPADPKRLAIGGISSGCYVKTSADGGKTWGTRVQLPVGDGDCNSAPALTYAADGGRLYAAYLGYRPTEYLVFVSMSTDQGGTWSVPTIAMARVDCFYCNGFFGARIAAAPDGRWVYVTARDLIVHDGYSASLLFSRSGDLGLSWSPVKSIASGFTFSGPPLLSSALAAGGSGRVLIAYGWRDDDHLVTHCRWQSPWTMALRLTARSHRRSERDRRLVRYRYPHRPVWNGASRLSEREFQFRRKRHSLQDQPVAIPELECRTRPARCEWREPIHAPDRHRRLRTNQRTACDMGRVAYDLLCAQAGAGGPPLVASREDQSAAQ